MSRAQINRVSIGFQGGQVLALRISADELKSLNRALPDGGWHEVASDDATVNIDLGQVVYVRTDRDEARVGFGT